MAGLRIADFLPLIGLGGRDQAKETIAPENPLFDRAFYAESYPFVVKGGIDLHEHYAYFGCRNGYNPNPYFDSAWYVAQNADVAATGVNPLDHYLAQGAMEGRNPSPGFSSWLYLIMYPDVKASGMNPLQHFLEHGKTEGRLALPVLLIPSCSTMNTKAEDLDLDIQMISAAEPIVHLIRNWTGHLLDRIASDRTVG